MYDIHRIRSFNIMMSEIYSIFRDVACYVSVEKSHPATSSHPSKGGEFEKL